MRKLFKLFLYFVSVVITIVAFTSIIITVFYSDNIKQSVVRTIQSNLNSKANLSDLELTLWEHFPYASVKFNDFLVYEEEGFNNDTLLYAKEAFCDFNFLDIISKKYTINRIFIWKGVVNVKYDKENNPNYSIFKTDNSDNKKILIKQVVLINTRVIYSKLVNNTTINWNVSEAVIKLNEKKITVNAEIFSNQLFIGKMDYVNNKKCSFWGELTIAEDTLHIHNSRVLIEDVLATVSGSIIQNNKVDLNIIGEKQQLNTIISHMPEKFNKICAPFIAGGGFDCNATIKGIISKNSNPFFNMNFKISNGAFEIKKVPFILNHINATGNINNGKNANYKSTVIKFHDFNAKPKNGNLAGNFTITNLNNYFLSAQLTSAWDLSEVNHYFEDSPFFDLTGRLTATTNYKGNLSFDKKNSDYFIDAQHNSEINFLNINFKYLNSALNFNISSANCSLNNDIINIRNSSLNISESDFAFTGELESFIPYILQKTNKMSIRGDLISSKMLFNELMTIKDISKGESASSLPKWISVDINSYITDFRFDNFNASNINGKIQYNNQVLRGVDLIANSLEGHLHAGFILTEPTKNYLVLKADLEFDKINIRKSFESFQNFNQDFIHQNELNGVGTAELNIEAHWKPSLIFNNKKLKIKSHLIIEQGELINFKPLENLSSFVSLDDLKHVKFSTLENTIEVENKVITIPAMEIKSSALSVFLSGTHTFEQEIDYSIKLLLSELLSNKFRKKNTTIENQFGEINEEEKKFTTIYLKMTGDTDDPKISFDGLKIKENINTEIETIKTIIKEDVLKIKESSVEEPGQDVIIEWEDEGEYNPK